MYTNFIIMLDKYNIPKLNIPKSATSKNEFKIFSNNLIIFLNNFIKDINKKLDTEKTIDEQMKRYNECYYNGVYDCLNLFNYNLFSEINEKKFWRNLISDHTCIYEHKSKNKYNKICNRSIHIETLHKYGKYLCCRHIPKKYYEKKTNVIDDNDRCNGFNKYGERCNITKKYGNYCFHHKKYPTIIEDVTSKTITFDDPNAELLVINKKYNIYERFKYTYDKNDYSNIKLICFYNDKSYFEELSDNSVQNIQEGVNKEIIINNLEIKKNVEKLKKIKDSHIKKSICNSNIHDLIKETYNEIDILNININNFKYKLDIINEILNIDVKCDLKGCNNIKHIYLMKSFFCKDHNTSTIHKQYTSLPHTLKTYI